MANLSLALSYGQGRFLFGGNIIRSSYQTNCQNIYILYPRHVYVIWKIILNGMKMPGALLWGLRGAIWSNLDSLSPGVQQGNRTPLHTMMSTGWNMRVRVYGACACLIFAARADGYFIAVSKVFCFSCWKEETPGLLWRTRKDNTRFSQ